MNIRPIFRWYDIWIGVFIDRPNHRVYVFPIPCLGVRIQWRKAEYVFANPKPNLFDGPWTDWPGEGPRGADRTTPGSYYLRPDTIEDDR